MTKDIESITQKPIGKCLVVDDMQAAAITVGSKLMGRGPFFLIPHIQPMVT